MALQELAYALYNGTPNWSVGLVIAGVLDSVKT